MMTRNELHSILLSAFALAASLTGPNLLPHKKPNNSTPRWPHWNNI
jgi:hypothetical protein